MRNINIKVFDILLKVSSNNNNFLSFVENYFSSGQSEEETDKVDIDLSFAFKPGFSFRLNGDRLNNQGVNLGENVGQKNDGSFTFCHHEVTGEFLLSAENWSGVCTFQKNFIKHLANLLFFKRSKTMDHYYRFISRLIIQNLLFLKIREKNNKSVILSAAAVAINNESFIFAGLPGSGKTTIINAIKDIFPDLNVLSENYAVIINGKIGYFTEGKHICNDKNFPVTKVFVINRSNNFSIIENSGDSCFAMLSAINQYTSELPEYSPFINLLLLSDKFNYMISDEYLKEFSHFVKSFSLTADQGAAKLIEYFKNAL